MKIEIKRFDKGLPLPAYKSQGAAAMDLAARETVTILAGKVGYIPLNVAVEIPEGYWLMVAPRGSTHKLGLLMVNSFALGDPDFKGDNDEYVFPAFNFTDADVTVDKGTRIAQMLLVKNEKIELQEVEKLGNPDRGMLGSTGSK
jgi:dUTP pyrophosphatase